MINLLVLLLLLIIKTVSIIKIIKVSLIIVILKLEVVQNNTEIGLADFVFLFFPGRLFMVSSKFCSFEMKLLFKYKKKQQFYFVA